MMIFAYKVKKDSIIISAFYFIQIICKNLIVLSFFQIVFFLKFVRMK